MYEDTHYHYEMVGVLPPAGSLLISTCLGGVGLVFIFYMDFTYMRLHGEMALLMLARVKVLTFQETSSNAFPGVRIKNATSLLPGRSRNLGSPYGLN